MFLAGSDDGVYHLTGVRSAPNPDAVDVDHVLESGRVVRLRTFDGVDGAFAATMTGLYHSRDGESWTDLGVPTEMVYAVGASADATHLYAGTRPAAIYRASLQSTPAADDSVTPRDLEWVECEGFQDLPSRADWRLPRHENLAQVRDVHGTPADAAGVVAGVEVGGVHHSPDRGDSWRERRGDVDGGGYTAGDRSEDWSERPGDLHDDVHELHVVAPDEWIAATGYGLFRTTDGGESWTRLDGEFAQRYFRSAYAHDGTVYAGGAMSNSGNWDDPAEDPGFFAYTPNDGLRELATPRPDQVVTGLTAVDGDVYAGTHQGSLLRERDGEWRVVGEFPVDDATMGRYTPLAWLDA